MKLFLTPSMFSTMDRVLVENEQLTISSFTFNTGVEALRIKIGRGEFIWLPFYAQSLWSWKVDGTEQKFNGFVPEPDYDAIDFLHNYGGFLIHCGITGMGHPGEGDEHLHHGELPRARYTEAWIEIDERATRPVVLSGRYTHRIPFKANYAFSPTLSIAADGTSVIVESTLENLQNTSLQYMYLNHLNFSLEGARSLQYGIPHFTADHVTVLSEVIDGIVSNPARLLAVDALGDIEPELVAVFKNAGQHGPVMVNTLVRDDGGTVWVATDTGGLDHTVIWLTRNADRSAAGFTLPATAGPRGFSEEARHGNIKRLEAGGQVHFKFAFGVEDAGQHNTLQQVITSLGGTYGR